MLLIAIPLYALQLGATPLVIGAVISAPYLLPLILAIPMGGVITTLGGRKVILLGGAGMSLAPVILLLVPGYPGLILAQVMVGLAQILMVLAAQTVISAMGSGTTLEKYFGWYTTSLSGGQLVGPLLAGWLIDQRGMGLTFGVMSTLALIGVLGAAFLVGDASRRYANDRALSGYRAQARLLKSNHGVQMSIALTVAGMFVLGAHGGFLPVYLENLEISATTIGALLSLRALSAMAVRPFMSTVIMLVGGRGQAVVGCVVCLVLGIVFTGVINNVLVLALLTVLVGIGSGVSQPLSMVILAEHVAPERRPSALGMRLMANRGVQFLAPFLLGALAEYTSFAVAFTLGGVFTLLMLLFIAVLLPRFSANGNSL
ncbi:hypothetical protein BG841_11695 [Marinobacter sp. X15-166B]|nr:hypothetical protein BG841_11695 [Marinobacter sp. X15-166B]